jgi:hypothetical protein
MTIELDILELIDLRVLCKVRLMKLQETNVKNEVLKEIIAKEIAKLENLLNKLQ